MRYRVNETEWHAAADDPMTPDEPGKCRYCYKTCETRYVEDVGLICAVCYFAGLKCEEPGCELPAVNRRELPPRRKNKIVCAKHILEENER